MRAVFIPPPPRFLPRYNDTHKVKASQNPLFPEMKRSIFLKKETQLLDFMPQTFMPPFWLNAMCLFHPAFPKRRNLCKNKTKTFAFSCFFPLFFRMALDSNAETAQCKKSGESPFLSPFFFCYVRENRAGATPPPVFVYIAT